MRHLDTCIYNEPFWLQRHSGKSATIRESYHGSGVCKEHHALYYVPKSSILLAGTDVWKISSVACGFRSIKIDYSHYRKSLIHRINDVMLFLFFFNKISLFNILLWNFHRLLLIYQTFIWANNDKIVTWPSAAILEAMLKIWKMSINNYFMHR